MKGENVTNSACVCVCLSLTLNIATVAYFYTATFTKMCASENELLLQPKSIAASFK